MGALAGLLAAGLALRVIIAYLLPGSGFSVDLNAFQFWAANLAQHGPWGFYDRPFFHDYTPGYLYALWLIGYLGQLLGGLGDLIKLPAIIADLALGYLAWSLVLELGGSERRALLAAAFVLFLPVTWFDSVVWGQVDSVGLVFLLLALRATWRDQPERAAMWGTVAAVIKPQLGIIIPIVAAVVIRRALFGRPPDEAGLDPDPAASAAATEAPAPDEAGRGSRLERLRHWSATERGPVRIVTTTAVGVATAALLAAPFGMTLPGLIRQIVETAGGYPYLTVNADNPWALVTRAGQGLAATGTWLCDAVVPDRCAEAVTFGPVWAVFVGSALILAVIAIVMVVVARHPDRRTILVGLAILAIAFFVVPTRVHERYLYPFIIIGTVLAALSLRWRIAYLVLVVANFLNLYVVLTTLYPDNPSISDWLGIGGAIRSPAGVSIIALVHLAAFAWAFVQLRPGARAALAREVAAAHPPPIGVGSFGADAAPPTTAPPASPAVAAVAASSTAGLSLRDRRAEDAARMPASGDTGDRAGHPTAAPDAGSTSGIQAAGGWLGQDVGGMVAALRRRVDSRPIRPDRSRALTSEGLGRFARIDLWILVVLVVGTLCFRLFRLDQPPTMHFDEVYHARTATEFLQSWRYGEDHAIYEYTHPHLAKYAMAAGVVLFGDDRVTAQSDLGAPVADATIERRWEDPSRPGQRAGERLYAATGTGVRAYDLESGQPVASIDAPGAISVSVDPTDHRLYIGTGTGEIRVIDTTELDVLDPGSADAHVPSDPFATVGAPVRLLLATSDGTAVVAATTDDEIVSLDTLTGQELGRTRVVGATQMAEGGTGDALVARPGDIDDPEAVASVLVELLGGSVDDYLPALTSEAPVVVIPAGLDAATSANIRGAIAEDRLPGIAVESRTRVAVAGDAGVTFVATVDAGVIATVDLGGPAEGIAQVTGLDEPRLYATDGREVAIIGIGGTSASDPKVEQRIPLPGAGSWVAYDEAVQMVHVLGDRPDGSGKTVYVIEPHGNAVYADASLPFDPSAWAVDDAPMYPAADRQQLLVFAPDGEAASVDIGNHAVAWRLPGVLAGVLAGALLYLLTRMLFARRSVAIALAVFVAVDPMDFVQSRIAMNDVYAGLFIIAAVALFAALWTGWWRWRGAFWVAMPIVGVLLGLALASKWVGAYAMGALAVLVLVRSALGRVVLLAGLVVMTTVLGYWAVAVPGGDTSGPNLTFLVIMIAVTLIAVAVTVLRPIAWSDDEVRFAVGLPAVLGIVAFLVAVARGVDSTVPLGGASMPLVSVAFGLIALAGLIYLAFLVAGRLGLGPMSPPPALDDPARLLSPPSPPPVAWLRPGAMLGLPVLWIGLSLLVVPIAVYILSYVPWALLGGHQIVPGWPPGHTGQTLWDLTVSMYDYHDKLRATHAAASPWWAWPFDLKPVWFYQGSFAASTAAAVYDHGSLVTWWLAIPAMAFVAWQSFARRSLSLMLVAVLFLCLWLPWVRIDRATFQYHWYTSLPFMLIALAYFIAEIWHGASRRTWLLARVSAALAIMGPALMWIFKQPLCTLAGVDQVYPDSPACTGDPGDLVLTTRVMGIAIVVLIGSALVMWQLVHLDRPDRDGRIDIPRRLALLVLTALGTGIGLMLATGLLGDAVVIAMSGFSSLVVALIVAIPLGAVAWVVLTARDARRFVVGFGIAAVMWTLILYPNIAALPLPSAVVNAYQGILPTYLYPFQFAVNTDQATAASPLFALGPGILMGALVLTAIVVAYSAWVWRLALAERAARATDGSEDGLEPGPA